jgi:hypothetical protein
MSNMSSENEDMLEEKYVHPVKVFEVLRKDFPRLFNDKGYSFGEYNKVMMEEFRIQQWEIQSRDFMAERRRSYRISYNVATETLIDGKDTGLPGCCPPDTIEKMIRISRKCLYDKYSKTCLNIRTRDKKEAGKKEIKKKSKQFKLLLKDAHHFNLWGFEDILKTINSEINETKDKMLVFRGITIPDGELTFFSLLWLLRRMRRYPGKCDLYKQSEWLEGKSKSKNYCPHINFEPCEEAKSGSWWTPISLSEFALLNGLLICINEGEEDESKRGYLFSERWFIMINWLSRWNEHVSNDKKYSRLPLKELSDGTVGNVNHDYDVRIKKAFRDFLGSEALRKFLYKRNDDSVNPDIDIGTFGTEHFSKFVECLLPLLEENVNNDVEKYIKDPDLIKAEIKQSEWPSKDYSLFRLARVQLLPAEFLLRAYQPYQLHLMILALDISERDQNNIQNLTTQNKKLLVPSSICFASIAGKIPEEIEFNAINEIPEESKAFEWLAPYSMLFSSMSTHFSLKKIRDDYLSMGKEVAQIENYGVQVHEKRHFLRIIDKRAPKSILENAQLFFTTLYGVDKKNIDFAFEWFSLTKKSLKCFVKQAVLFALKLEFSIKWSLDNSIDTWDKVDDNELREEIDKDVNDELEKYFTEGINSLDEISMEMIDKEKLFYFFCALLASFRNIIKHSRKIWREEISTVNFEIINDHKMFVAINKSLNYNINMPNGTPNIKSDGTVSVLRYFINKYNDENYLFNNDIIKLRKSLGDDLYLFQTSLPIPR